MPWRVQAVFQGATLLPEDRFINTFHFLGQVGTPDADIRTALHAAVQGFYFNSYGRSASVGGYLSTFIVTEWQTVIYDLSLPEGEREPDAFTWDLPTRSGVGLPEEVAVCLTLAGAPPVTPRRRGRMYVGPLLNLSQVIDDSSTSTPTRVNTTDNQSIGNQLAVAAKHLVDEPLIEWCVRSITPSENFVPIVGGWVDNAFDIQRRRGPDPTVRRLWPIAGDEAIQ